MPFIVNSRKIFKEIVNGSAFTDNSTVFDTFLKANAINNLQALYGVELSWSSLAELGVPFTISGNIITRPHGSFLEDGFIDGDEAEIVHNAGATTSTRTIASVNNTILIYDGANLGDEIANNIQIHGITDLQGVEFTYNLLENEDSFTEANLQDGSVMQFRVDSIDTPTPNAFKLAQFSANPITGQNGSFQVRKVSSNVGRVQKFEFKHNFKNFPYFLDSERASFEGGANIGLLKDGGSLKYSFRFKGGKTSQNPNERKFVFENQTLGNSGGFDENFNGNQPAFVVDSISYKDSSGNPLTSLDVLNDTNVEIFVSSPTGIDLDFNHKVIAYFSKLPDPISISSTNTFEENFVIDSLLTTRNASAVSSTAIEDLLVVAGPIASNQLKINFTTRFNASQKAFLKDGDSYLISIEVDDLNNLNTFTTNARADVNTLTKSANVEGLFNLESFGFYRQDMDVSTDLPYTDYKGWVEDMFLMESVFGLDKALNAKIQDLTFKLVAFNTVTESHFDIYSQRFVLSDSPQASGVQQISKNVSLNYNLPSSDRFNKMELFNNGVSGTKELYKLFYPFRLSYADYLALLDVDGVFFDNTQPNDGLNQNLSNYSGVNNYEIKVFIEANVSNDNFSTATLYRERLPSIEVFDYQEDGASMYSSASIELQTLSGIPYPDQLINRSQDTIVKGTCNLTTPMPSGAVVNGDLRLETYQSGGNNKIQETDSLIIPLGSNTIQPLITETKLKVVNNGSSLEFEGLIKEATASILPDNKFTISVRPFVKFGTAIDGKLMEDGTTKVTEDSTTKEEE